MMSIRDLHLRFDGWKQWATTADRSEPGWQSNFPAWPELASAAAHAISEPNLDQQTLAVIAECWAASEESEELLDLAKAMAEVPLSALEALAGSGLAACRWQAYELASCVGSAAESILRRGLHDADPYARRRAILAIARLCPPDAQVLAESCIDDGDPYLRQATIELVVTAKDSAFRAAALTRLAADPVEHVRQAARRRMGG